MVTNADKCHLLTSASEEVSVKIENEIIKNSLQEKLLGIVVDNRLTFEPHVKKLCKKAGIIIILDISHEKNLRLIMLKLKHKAKNLYHILDLKSGIPYRKK